MIEFTTLFLALTLGRQQVEMSAADPVVAIEISLDGVEIGRLESPPWRFEGDLGDALLPHELEAAAFDARGKKIGEARQWLNYGRGQVEARWVPDPDQEWPPQQVRLLWQSFNGEPPVKIEASFDGEAVELGEDMRVDLGEYDPSIVHSLEAELAFDRDLSVRAALSLGGLFSEQVSTALTAISLCLPEGLPRPSLEEVSGWLRHRSGEPLLVPYLGTEGAAVLIVRDRFLRRPLPLRAADQLRRASPRDRVARKKMDLFLLGTTPRMVSIQGVEPSLYKPYRVQGSWRRRGVFHAARRLAPQRSRGSAEPESSQTIYDALAIAGKLAGQSGRRRAVLLLQDPASEDHSNLTHGNARRFLRALRVPYFSWVSNGETPLGEVVRNLENSLERQLVVWINGQFLPSELELTESAPRGTTFAGTEGSPQ